jgi:hypothetical protein
VRVCRGTGRGEQREGEDSLNLSKSAIELVAMMRVEAEFQISAPGRFVDLEDLLPEIGGGDKRSQIDPICGRREGG